MLGTSETRCQLTASQPANLFFQRLMTIDCKPPLKPAFSLIGERWELHFSSTAIHRQESQPRTSIPLTRSEPSRDRKSTAGPKLFQMKASCDQGTRAQILVFLSVAATRVGSFSSFNGQYVLIMHAHRMLHLHRLLLQSII